MKSVVLHGILLALMIVVATGAAFSQAPTITSFTPSRGSIGSSVTIAGTSFNATPANNTVFFGGAQATVTGATTTSLTVTVPDGATFFPISVTTGGHTAFSNIPFTPTFNSARVVDSMSFAPAAHFGMGVYPLGMVAADLDGDGKVDIACVSAEQNNISIYHNTATLGQIDANSLAPRIILATGLWPNMASAVDVDGDGKLDLVVVSYGDNAVGVLRNISTPGNIAFSPLVSFPVGTQPTCLAYGDIDGDGLPELAVGNAGSSSLSLMRNLSTPGTIAFDTKYDLYIPGTPRGVQLADLDGDGYLDIVVSQIEQQISYIPNTRSTIAFNFGTRTDIITEYLPQDILLADLNLDGKPDLIAMGVGCDYHVMQNTSTTGAISFAAPVNFRKGHNGGLGTGSISIGDLDGDGRIDLIFSSPNDSTISIQKNLGTGIGTAIDGTFFADSMNIAVRDCFRTVVTDIDGDGYPEIVSSSALLALSTVNVHRNLSGTTHAVTVTQVPNCAIAPVGPLTLYHGASQSFAVTPDPNYLLDSVMVDGGKVAATSPYVLDHIWADHAVTANVHQSSVTANVRVFLQGPSVAAADTMKATLNVSGVLTTHFGSVQIPSLAVDSITIELRDAATVAGSTIRRFAPAWLLSNGTICSFGDSTKAYIQFDTTLSGSYYIVVRHRNHLAVMSAAAQAIGTSITPVAYDFTTGQDQAYGTNPMIAVGTKYGMYAGNGNGDGSINAVDRNAIWRTQNGSIGGYYGGDFNLDGNVTAVDRNAFWRVNNGTLSQVP